MGVLTITMLSPEISCVKDGVDPDSCLSGPLYGPRREKTFLRGFANNTGADQPAHLRSLISALVIHYLETTICKLATGEISILLLVSVAEETVLKLALSDLPKTGFLVMWPIYFRGHR